MLPQLSRPDPTMSGTNGGIIIGQDFIPLTHHDIPLQSEHYAVLRTVKDSSKWMLSRYLPELLMGQGEESRQWSTSVTLRWTCCFAVESWGNLSQRCIMAVVSWEVGAGGQGRVVLSRQLRETWTKPLLSTRTAFHLLKMGILCFLRGYDLG